jgi:dihydrodipicolinate reductase
MRSFGPGGLIVIKVGVLGAKGRMGSEVCRAVEGAADMELVAAVDQGDALEALTAADAVVDFTYPGVVMDPALVRRARRARRRRHLRL